VRPDLPSGTVTFLFTDVEGSTRLLHDLGAEAYAQALAEHRDVIRYACTTQGGVEVDTQGDAFFFAFPTAPGALAAAAAFTEELASGPIRVRVGLHTGTPHLTDEGYVGGDVHRAARIAAAGHGGQVLISASTAALADVELFDLGEHRFKDLAAAERVFQLGSAEFPPLKSLYRSNLPIPAHPLVGRKKELLDVRRLLLGNGARIVTVTGPGGVGKTRFAVAAAAEVSDEFPDGVWFVPLASIRDPELVLPTVAAAVGAEDDLARHLGGGVSLLVLDNLEHVIDASPAIAELVGRCPRLRVLATSRESLRVRPEHEYPLMPLPESPAVELLRQRVAAVAPEQEVEWASAVAICHRVDRLPLAIELAAARCRALSPTQILERLSQRLDLLKGGRDAEARQQTLRATIEWSYELLAAEEQELFARFAVFVGGCTLDAAEDVCAADVDTLQSLVEKSLVRFTSERYWMLETIREFAVERLRASGEEAAMLERLAHHLIARAIAEGAPFFEPDQSRAYARLEPEHPNTRAVMEWALRESRYDVALELVGLFAFVWGARGHVDEAWHWADGALAGRATVSDAVRARALIAASDMAKVVGDLERAAEVAKELVETMSDRPGVDQLAVASALADLSDIARVQGDVDRARELAERSLEFRVARGLPGARAHSSLGALALAAGDLEVAERHLRAAADDYVRYGHDANYTGALADLGEVSRRRGDLAAAESLLREALQVRLRLGHREAVGEALLDLAVVAGNGGDRARASRLWGAGWELIDNVGAVYWRERDPGELDDEARLEGATMSFDEAVKYALASLD
jgi:predicted ATPase